MNIAHRGFSAAYPENTLRSFNEALNLGVTQVELDLQLTKDGELVVLHDRTVDRTTDGTGEAKHLLLEEIKQLDAGSWKADEFSGLRIPTYREVATELDKTTTLVTELKFESDDGVRAVIDLINDLGIGNRVVISSFDLQKLPIVRELAPSIPTTALLKTSDLTDQEKIDQVKQLGAGTIGPRCSDTTNGLVKMSHDQGLQVRCWGLGRDQGPELTRILDLGVDGMTTDCPDILQRILIDRGMD